MDHWISQALAPRITAAAIVLLGALAAALLAHGASPVPSGPAAFRWITYANTALAASAVLYTVHLWLREEPVGRGATVLAAGGAAGILIALALGMPRDTGSGIGLYEGTALFAAAAVLAYLAIERAYGNRSAGVAVMPAVMVAVLCEMWLIGEGLANTGRLSNGFSGYWIAGHRFALWMGYCPLVAGAALASLGGRRPARGTPRAVLAALWLGAPLLFLGAAMGAIGSIIDWSTEATLPAYLATFALIAPMGFAVRMQARGADDARLARNAIAVFIVSTAGLLLSTPFASVPG